MNKIKSRILWVLITILLCLCFVFFGMSKVNAASSESAAYDIYTDSDQIIGYNGYTILLWLDGEANICGIQQPFKIYDEQGNLIAEDGDLELAAYESFHNEEN